jgi:hypothetical protein
MSLDINKLERVLKKPDGKIIARCPACAVEGGDKKGEHLVVFSDGNFGCVKYPQDPEHRKKIYSLAGDGKKRTHLPVKLAVTPSTIPKPSAVMNLASFPRFSGRVKRSWPHKQSDPPIQNRSAAEESPQLEFAFMDDLRQPPQNKPVELPYKASKFNVPPKPFVSAYPTLPPKPMRDRV